MQIRFEKIPIPDYEEVYKVTESSSHLEAIIAIHSTLFGPALGGVRIFPYLSFQDALDDVLNLSKGMTFKAIMADAKLGGGKAVIIANPRGGVSKEKLVAFAKAVDSLKGRYYTAEDSGITPKELLTIRETTPYVVGLDSSESSGNPCPFTAWGTFRAITSTLYTVFGSETVRNRTIAIQGLGAVGMLLAEILFWHGAHLIVSDIYPEKAIVAKCRFGATIVDPEEIYQVPCDIFSPCAMGGVLHAKTIEKLQAKGIAGCANNQLSSKEDCNLLVEKGILYAPDYVANAGGLINVQYELLPGGYNPLHARESIDQIFYRLQEIFILSKEKKITPHDAALRLVEEKIKKEANKVSL